MHDNLIYYKMGNNVSREKQYIQGKKSNPHRRQNACFPNVISI